MERNSTTAQPKASGSERADVPAAGEHVLSLTDQVRKVMIDRDLSQKAVAHQSGVGSTATFNLWLNGKYTGDVAKIDTKMRKWLQSLGERASISQLLPTAPEFFESETSKLIIGHLQTAHAMGGMLAGFGISGIGKTTSLRWYSRAYPNAWLATFSPYITTVIPVLQEVSEAIGGEKAKAGQGARRVMTSIRRVLNGSQGILICDEAHHLSLTSLDAIRSLHDETGVSVALFGGPELHTKIMQLPQVHSRIGLRLHLTRVLEADVDAQLNAWGVQRKEIRKVIHEFAKQPGGLRGVNMALRLANVVANRAGAELSLEHVKDAVNTLANTTGGED